jgi:diadenosine tetraphosphatase ApaH/serine/threonine PP2A family protein phosphatase
VRALRLGPGDQLVSVGDLLHRGPDPAGVCDVLRECGARFVLGNHEHAVLRRAGLAPKSLDGGDRPALPARLPDLDDEDLAGDGRQPCRVAEERRSDVLRYLAGHAGFALRGSALPGSPRTHDGRDFVVVHAGRTPGVALEKDTIGALTSLRRLDGPGRPWWYEGYAGPDLVVFGHTPSPLPRAWRRGEQLVALGLDTGCVYGGKLSAYSPELDEFACVPARRAYARESG